MQGWVRGVRHVTAVTIRLRLIPIIGWLDGWNGIFLTKPAVQVNIRAAFGAKWAGRLLGLLSFANRAKRLFIPHEHPAGLW